MIGVKFLGLMYTDHQLPTINMLCLSPPLSLSFSLSLSLGFYIDSPRITKNKVIFCKFPILPPLKL